MKVRISFRFLGYRNRANGQGRGSGGSAYRCSALDANYVRRPDAEIFWKGTAAHGTKTKRDSVATTIRAFGEADAAAAAEILRASPGSGAMDGMGS